MRLPLIIVTLTIIGALAGGFALAHQKSAPTALKTADAATIESAWIEVRSDPVYQSTGEKKSSLKNGDSVEVGATIETGETGTAVIHYPDGSLARMNVNTTLTLSAISFDTSDDSLIVSIGLSAGRVWSKVVGLTTPESSWEVHTSNTVATVRGTAFGVGYENGASFVLGSEHTVAVAPIDPKTKQKIIGAEVTLEADRLLQLSDADAAAASIATGSSTIAAKITPVGGDFRTDAWIQTNQATDRQFNEKIDELRAQGASDAAVRDKIRKEDAQLKNILIQTPEVTPIETQKNAIVPSVPVVPSTPAVKTEPPPVTILPTAATTNVSASRTVSNLTEDDTVQFRAVAGTGRETKDITSNVSWRVTGSIGSITPKGLFTALLGSDVSEFGEGTGFVTATLPNGEVIRSASIHVQAKIPTGLGTEG